jgi:hypothetical protein
MKTQYYDVLMTHPNPLAFGKAFAEGSRTWSSVTFAKAFADTFGVARDELGALDTKFGAQYWLRLLESGQYRWLAWECDNGQSFCCFQLPKEQEEEDSSFLLVNLTNASYQMTSHPETSYLDFCSSTSTSLVAIKGQPIHPTTPTRTPSIKEVITPATAVLNTTKEIRTEPKAPKKASRKRPVPKDKEEAEEVTTTVEPEAKKALFVEP